MADECPHVFDEESIGAPMASTDVHKDECMYCFETNERGDGVFVCLKCFAGMCKDHLDLHRHKQPTHVLFLQIKRLPPPERKKEDIKSIADALKEADPVYDMHLLCVACQGNPEMDAGLTIESIDGIKTALSPQRKDALRSAENDFSEPKKECPHLQTLQQDKAALKYNPQKPPRTDEICHQQGCTCNTNNWMCLTCGAVGCPRAEAGGQQHAINHFLFSGHPTVVKLGTVTPTGADCHCYACDSEIKSTRLKEHLANLGIDMGASVKTSKTLAEMALDQMLQHEHDTITEAGKKLEPSYGPGYTPIHNFGNTCYMNSCLQVLFSIPEFKDRFFGKNPFPNHFKECTASSPQSCYLCQTQKLGYGLLSGQFAKAAPAELKTEHEHNCFKHIQGVTPRAFKKLIAGTHPEFSTGHQQDASEYLKYLLEHLSRSDKAAHVPESVANPGKVLEFVMEDRIQCDKCKGVSCKKSLQNILTLGIPVTPPPHEVGPDGKAKQYTKEELEARRPSTTLDACLAGFLEMSTMDCKCESCGQPTQYKMTTRMETFPQCCALQLRREYFDRDFLTTRKLDVNVDVPEKLNLEGLKAIGVKQGEKIFSSATQAPSAPSGGGQKKNQVDEVALVQIVSMGIEPDMAQWALENTSNNVDRAIDWVFSHPEGPPPKTDSSVPAQQQKAAEVKAATNGPPQYKLFAIISHIGASATSGHYLAHVKKDGKWHIFNDEKVAVSEAPPFKLGSIYFFERC